MSAIMKNKSKAFLIAMAADVLAICGVLIFLVASLVSGKQGEPLIPVLLCALGGLLIECLAFGKPALLFLRALVPMAYCACAGFIIQNIVPEIVAIAAKIGGALSAGKIAATVFFVIAMLLSIVSQFTKELKEY